MFKGFMRKWQVQEAKMKLSELINEAKKHPQLITVRGEDTVIVISKREYEKLAKPKLSIYQAMQQFPYKNEQLEFKRINSQKLRDVDL